MKRILLLFLFSSPLIGFSQTLHGYVYDSLSRRPLAMATVTLLDTQLVRLKATLSDSLGRYSFQEMPAKKYYLLISMAGYRSSQIVQKPGDTVFVSSNVTVLASVTVTSQRLISVLPDGFRYDAAKELQAGGESAADILRKLPAIIVDGDGLPTIRGSNRVKVFIDGKPSELYASSVKDALLQISAANIARVYVITSPSAKYDGEGVDAVIQIYTKKPVHNGVSGALNILVGNRSRQLTGDVKWRTGKWIISADGGNNFSSNPTQGNVMRLTKNTGSNILLQQVYSKKQNRFNPVGVSILFNVDSLSWLSMGYRKSARREDGSGSITSSIFQNDTLTSVITRNTDSYVDRKVDILSASYQRSSKDKKLEWNLLVSHFILNSEDGYKLDQMQGAVRTYEEKNRNKAVNHESLLQWDLSKKFAAGVEMETGIKAVQRNYTNNSQFTPDLMRSGDFYFKRSVAAGYVTISLPVGKWKLRAGARYEQTNLSISFKNLGVPVPVYKNLLPNLLISRNFDQNHSLSFSYSKKLQRPDMSFLNPVVNYSDTFNITYGNPALDPEITHSVEAAYSYRKNSWFFNSSVFFSRSENSIQQVSTLKPNGIVENTYRNIASMDVAGWTGNLSYQYKKLNISTNNVLRYMRFNALSTGLSNSGFIYSTSLQATYKFSDVFTAGTYAGISPRKLYLQGSTTGLNSLAIWINRSFYNKKLNFSLRIDNPFSPYQYIKDENHTLFFDRYGENRIPSRFYKVGISYKFGKKEVRLPAIRSLPGEN